MYTPKNLCIHFHYHLDQEQDYHILTNLCNGHINFVKLTYEEYWTVTIKNNDDDDDDPDPSDDTNAFEVMHMMIMIYHHFSSKYYRNTVYI